MILFVVSFFLGGGGFSFWLVTRLCCLFWFRWFLFATGDETGDPHAVAFLLGLGST